MGLNLKQIGGMRLLLVGLSLASLPMVLLADMQPTGIGVMTAYVIPALVVLFFFVVMLDALMNRVLIPGLSITMPTTLAVMVNILLLGISVFLIVRIFSSNLQKFFGYCSITGIYRVIHPHFSHLIYDQSHFFCISPKYYSIRIIFLDGI